ncbi:hypothetical protein ACEQPO_27940 [Bacillus sp. SL00103]
MKRTLSIQIRGQLLHNHVELQFQNIQYALDNITEETFQQIVGKIASARRLCTSVEVEDCWRIHVVRINRLLGNCQYIDADQSDLGG